tara:strand:- start:5229 stop:5417 length:189 start_codon:yes stop_codon:yes gene_type:complete
MEWFAQNLTGIFNVVTTVVSVAAAVAALLPQASGASTVIAQIRKVVDVLALNFGNAKNASSE